MTRYERRAVSLVKPTIHRSRVPDPTVGDEVVWHLGGPFANAVETAPKGSRLVLETPSPNIEPTAIRLLRRLYNKIEEEDPEMLSDDFENEIVALLQEGP